MRESGTEQRSIIILAVVTINAWNRIGVPTRMSPE